MNELHPVPHSNCTLLEGVVHRGRPPLLRIAKPDNGTKEVSVMMYEGGMKWGQDATYIVSNGHTCIGFP